MAWWDGAQIDLLKALGVGQSTMQQQFIYDWNYDASSNCQNNPVDISHVAKGATNCKKLTSTRTAKNYTSHGQATNAFAQEVRSGNFPHLDAALKLDNPYTYANPAALEADLIKWGSPKFASYYLDNANPGSGSGSGSGTGGARLPKGHSGFHDMQKALAHDLPTALKRSKIIRGRVLRKLGAPRKVSG